MKMKTKFLTFGLLFLICGFIPQMVLAGHVAVSSPDGRLVVTVENMKYSVEYDGLLVIKPSALGLKTSMGDFTQGLRYVDCHENPISQEYDMRQAKAKHIKYEANQLVLDYQTADNLRLQVIFQVSNHDVAFRYTLPRPAKDNPKRAIIYKENTSFDFPDGTKTFLCPQIGPESGWEQTKPSYEEEYKADDEMQVKSKFGHGYTFPCLFKVPTGPISLKSPGKNLWALVSETGVSSAYCGSHLSDWQEGGYTIAFPDKGENNGFGSEFATIPLPGNTPWRTITVGTTLKPIVETTVAYDVVEPLYAPSENYKPGRYTWSWLIWQDKSINYDDQVKFIDLASSMGYEYCLVDNWWDQNIGRERIAELSRYAQSKGVHLLLWYNSNGFWNDAPQTPRDCMNTAIAREREMKWLKSIGVKGIKVDFFGGDKQQTIQLYEDILSDANRYGLQVIFHGCTLPRGWERMYPNFVGSEAVLASENVYFTDYHANQEGFELTLHPYIRNAVAAMDWGGVIMNKYLSKDNKSRHRRATNDIFEMATGITNQCAVNCIAMQPNNLSELPQFELDFLRNVPTTWDETCFIDGYPGKFVVMARRHGNDWYIAGLNGTQEPLKLNLDLPMLAGKTCSLYIDEQALKQAKVNKKGQFKVTIPAMGGMIIKE